jgi:hypothetical protein
MIKWKKRVGGVARIFGERMVLEAMLTVDATTLAK